MNKTRLPIPEAIPLHNRWKNPKIKYYARYARAGAFGAQ